MSKNEILWIIVITAVFLGLAGGGGWWLWQSRNKPESSQRFGSNQAVNRGKTLSAESDISNSLMGDSSGTSINLGQITPDPKINTPTESSKPDILDPATFSQYDKYKDATSALFAELQVGTGDELKAGKKAAVYYKGWLTNGKLFDMSRTGKDGKLQPFVFTLGAQQVIPGWEQGVAGMKVGGSRLLIVPPAAGYGTQGKESIPPNSVLIFQVQLAAVE